MDNFIKIVNEARWADGLKVRTRLDDITYNPMRSQEEFVMRMVRENASTDYGRKHGFSDIHSLEEFRRYIPLTTYDDYKPYIAHIAKGTKNVLTVYLTEHFSTIAGYRRLPQSRWSLQANYDYNFCTGFYMAGQHGYLTDGQTLNQLEIGSSYELVVTTLSGLYRYKTFKNFMVVGRYHDTPTVIIDRQ